LRLDSILTQISFANWTVPFSWFDF
jgi:hypothetical protein